MCSSGNCLHGEGVLNFIVSFSRCLLIFIRYYLKFLGGIEINRWLKMS